MKYLILTMCILTCTHTNTDNECASIRRHGPKNEMNAWDGIIEIKIKYMPFFFPRSTPLPPLLPYRLISYIQWQGEIQYKMFIEWCAALKTFITHHTSNYFRYCFARIVGIAIVYVYVGVHDSLTGEVILLQFASKVPSQLKRKNKYRMTKWMSFRRSTSNSVCHFYPN